MKPLLPALCCMAVIGSCSGSDCHAPSAEKNDRAMDVLIKKAHCGNMMLHYKDDKEVYDLYKDSLAYYSGVFDAIYEQEK